MKPRIHIASYFTIITHSAAGGVCRGEGGGGGEEARVKGWGVGEQGVGALGGVE